jgi:hypothetical protein
VKGALIIVGAQGGKKNKGKEGKKERGLGGSVRENKGS